MDSPRHVGGDGGGDDVVRVDELLLADVDTRRAPLGVAIPAKDGRWRAGVQCTCRWGHELRIRVLQDEPDSRTVTTGSVRLAKGLDAKVARVAHRAPDVHPVEAEEALGAVPARTFEGRRENI